MSAYTSFIVAIVAIAAAAVLTGLHDIDANQFLAVLVGAGIHVSSVTVPSRPATSAGGSN